MFVYLLRILLLFWIISIIVRWAERFFTGSQATHHDNTSPRSVNEPPDLGVTGTIEDADFVELDGDE